jgi:hypothetical protein
MKIPNNRTPNDQQSENNADRRVESTWVPLGQCSTQGAEVDESIVQGVPPGHEHLNIGRVKLCSLMTFI